MMNNRLFVGLFFLTMAHAQDVPPPPKPADSGPTLEVTMKFIADKLGAIGPVNSIAYLHDNSNQRPDWREWTREQITDVRPNVADCRVDYRWRGLMFSEVETSSGGPNDTWLVLKDVEEIVVKPWAQAILESKTKPPIFELTIKRKGSVPRKKSDRALVRFHLYDEALANRLAKALVHAAELCGGESKEPF
jgi:hypothetical protein